MNILIAILVLGIIIFIHELGHFLTAKFFKMPVSEFSIGMGPQVYSYETMKTTYSFRAIPLGGFVNIEGMEVGSEVEDGFNSKSPLARFVVLFAGVFMNFLLAFILIFTMIYSNGKYIQNKEAVIGSVLPESKGSKVIFPKDKILKIDGIDIKEWNDIGKILTEKDPKIPIQVELERAGKIENVNLELTEEPESKR